MPESAVQSSPSSSTSATKMLRLLAVALVLSSLGIMYLSRAGRIEDSEVWENGRTSISASTHPAFLVWDVLAITLFILLILRKPVPVTDGVPTMKRRVAAALIDFWFSLVVVTSIGALIPLWVEAARTGHFVWHFHRNYSVNTDWIGIVSGLFELALLFLYFAFPLTRGRQTVGDFIFRLRVTPPFGDDGRFTFKAAAIRGFYAFIGIWPLGRDWDRDEDGRTWYDRRINCIVRFVRDE